MIQGTRLLVKMFTSQILKSADQAYGVSHPAVEGNVTAVAGRAHARLRVGVLLRSQKTTQPTESCSPAGVAPRRSLGGG